MACSTCGHTLEKIGENERGDLFFLCPRCGTLLVDAFGQHGDRTYVPKLVGRCRLFVAEINPTYPELFDEWVRLGIAESIATPGERKGGA